MHIIVGSGRHDALLKANEWFGAPRNYSFLSDLIDWANREGRWGDCVVFVEVDIPAFEIFKPRNVDLIVAFGDRVGVCEVKNNRSLRAAEAKLKASLEQCCESYDLVRGHLASTRTIDKESVRPFLLYPNLDSKETARLIERQFGGDSSLTHVIITGGSQCSTKPRMPNGHPLYLPLAMRMRLGQVRPVDRSTHSGNAQSALRGLVPTADVDEFDDLKGAVDYVRREWHKTRAIRLPAGHVKDLDPARLQFALRSLVQFGLVEIAGPYGIGKSAFARELISLAAGGSDRHPRVATYNVRSGATLKSLCRELLDYFDLDPGDLVDENILIDRLLRVDGTVWFQSYDEDTAAILKQLLDEVLRRRDESYCRFLVESLVPLYPLDNTRSLTNRV